MTTEDHVRDAFATLLEQVMALVDLRASVDSPALRRNVDEALKRGFFLRWEVGVGAGGVLGMGLYLVREKDGHTVEVIYIPAPTIGPHGLNPAC